MKKIFCSTLILLFISTNFSGCKKKLEPEFFSQLTRNNFPFSQSYVYSLLPGFYSNFRYDWNGLYCAITRTSWRYLSSAVTDETKDNWNADGMGSQFNWGASSFGGLFFLAPVVARTTEF